MQYLYDPSNEKSYPAMSWGKNYNFFTNGMMRKLFFAGNDFTPKLIITDEATGEKLNVQDNMFAHYIGCLKEVAKRVKDMHPLENNRR